MMRASVVPIVVLGAALGLTGCGGGSDGAATEKLTSTGSGTNVAGNLGTNVGTNNDAITGSNTDTAGGVNSGPNAGTGSDAGQGGIGTDAGTDSGSDPGESPEGGSSTNDAACPVLNQCIDFNAVRIAKYKDNKRAAASYTFDDGYASSAAIGSIFENAGLRATFYIIPGIISADGWAMWQGMAKKGHEIGNHSMTHPDFVNTIMSDQQLDNEINGAQKLIEQKLGIRPQTFAFPYHLYTDRAWKAAQQNHFAVRKMDLDDPGYQFAFFDTDHGTDLAGTLMRVNRQLDEVVTAGGWFVAGGHGIDGDGWSPVTTDFLQRHLTHAAQYSPKLWTDTFANISRYRACRDTVKAEVLLQSSIQAYVRLTGTYDPTVCHAPLTVTVPVSIPSGATLRAKAIDGTEVPTRVSTGIASFNLRPGDKVSLQVVPVAQ